MSQCLTIDETIDQKDTSANLTPKDVVGFILEETLLSVFIISDKGCRSVGDFNITEDFNQRYDRLSYLRDFEQVAHSQNQSGSNQELNLNSGENVNPPNSLATANENLELVVDTFIRRDEKIKPINEYTIITEEILANNELQIENGQIHLEKNKTERISLDLEKQEYFNKKDVIKNNKIEIEYYHERKLNKIYVSLNSNTDCAIKLKQEKNKNENESEEKEVKEVAHEPDEVDSQKEPKRPFEPFTTEELRQSTLQVWENDNSSLVGKWNGDMLAQKEEVVRLMEELSSVQVFPENLSDPNRPRACAFAEEEVKKMTKEIEEINFTQSRANFDDFDLAYLPDGQGDADLETKSFTKSKNIMEKPQEEFYTNSTPNSKSKAERKTDRTRDREQEAFQNQSKELSQNINALTISTSECSTTTLTPARSYARNENNDVNSSFSSEPTNDCIPEKHFQHSEITEEEERLLKSSLYNESSIKIKASLDQVSHPNFSRDQSPEQIYEMKENLSCASCSVSKEDTQKTSEDLQKDSIDLKQLQNGHYSCEEFFPETLSLSGNVGSLSGSKQDEFTPKTLKISSELDLKSYQEKSNILKGSLSVNIASELTSYSNQNGTAGSERENLTTSVQTCNMLNRDSFSEEKNEKIPLADSSSINGKMERKPENDDFENFPQKFEILQNGENPNLMEEKISESLEGSSVSNEMNLNNLNVMVCDVENGISEIQTSNSQISINGSNSMITQNKPSSHESSNSLSNAEKPRNTETDKEPSVSSQSLSEAGDSNEYLDENGFSETSKTSNTKFKLHSQKMYFSADHDTARQALNEFTLLESEETFIDLTESVIQVIEPPETSTDEDCDKISFSLLFETPNQKTTQSDNKSESGSGSGSGSELTSEKNSLDFSENEICSKKVYSGMSTVGPIKNYDYDPKSLITPEIDYGKMTRITSSRQLSKDMNLFNSEMNTGISMKIVEEDDSDDDMSLNVEEDHVDRNSLLNRDIASLTKVQKVREVMSYQPKSEEDFEDEDALPRPRLDLKDVESMTDERYKVQDVSIPLLSFEIDDNNMDAGKELMESMGLVISGLTNPAYYEEEIEEATAKIQKSQSDLDTNFDQLTELSNENPVSGKSSKTLAEDIEDGVSSVLSLQKENKSKLELAEKLVEECILDENPRTDDGDSQIENGSRHVKYNTLGCAFKKASSKILRKDVENLLLRSSKSLPRETSKIRTTDSIRSLLDDCQSSASNMLKKSRSLLKNTQSIFRSFSQSMMSPDRNLVQNAGINKLSPSELDVNAMGKKFPSCLKTEYFTKTKISLKNMAEKTVRNVDIISSTSYEPETTSEDKNLRISDENEEENSRLDQTESSKKLLPKSPLIYKSQFVKSLMSFHDETPELVEASLELTEAEKQQNVEGFENAYQPDGFFEEMADEATETQVPSDSKETYIQGQLQWLNSIKDLYPLTNNEPEPPQLDYIVMETIQGLPTTELESPSSEKENLNVENNGNIKLEKGTQQHENDIKKIEASNSLQMFTDGNRDFAPCFPEADEEKMATKTSSERKIKAKKKKFTARFRSFWCSAFGRVKTRSKKADPS